MDLINRRDFLMKKVVNSTIRLSREHLSIWEKFKLKRQQKKDFKEIGSITRKILGWE